MPRSSNLRAASSEVPFICPISRGVNPCRCRFTASRRRYINQSVLAACSNGVLLEELRALAFINGQFRQAFVSERFRRSASIDSSMISRVRGGRIGFQLGIR